MAPKARIVRKNSTSIKNANAPTVRDVGAMPPPPDPPPPQAILEPEAIALSRCLQNAGVKTGQIYAFYADARRIGVDKHAAQPPRSLTTALGREVEKYDQLCDAIESYTARAISVLQRDLEREKARLKAEEEAQALQTQLQEEKIVSVSATATVPTNDSTVTELPTVTMPGTQGSPSALVSGSSLAGRRPSAISLSSLNRPQFPHKLDLSAAALRINPEELSQGLASPVTLAPKSGRLTATDELPPDFMAALASTEAATAANRSVDLAILPDKPAGALNINTEPTLGSSADRPIELDLEGMDIDMSDMEGLFSEAGSNINTSAGDVGLFQQSTQPTQPAATTGKKSDTVLDVGVLEALSNTRPVQNHGGNIFGSLGRSQQLNTDGDLFPAVSAPSASTSTSQPTAASPRSLLASLAGAGSSSSTNAQGPSGPGASFDENGMDFEDFPANFEFDGPLGADHLLAVEAFLNMNGTSTEKA